MSVYTTNDRELCCPLCGDVFVHIDEVQMAARPEGEDGREDGLSLTKTGHAQTVPGGVPVGNIVGPGRRHRIALIGWCEHCEGRFALVFTQHKGLTITESVPLADFEMFPAREAPADVEAPDAVR